MRQLLKKVWYRFFRGQPLSYVGRILIHVTPSDYVESCRRHLLSRDGPTGLLATIIRSEINRQYYALNDKEKRRWNRDIFWGAATGKKWHEAQTRDCNDPHSIFPESFLYFRRPLVAQLSDFLAKNEQYQVLCEIGTGNGLFLKYLSSQYPSVERFIGFDLNKAQVEENMRFYGRQTDRQTELSHSRLEFIHSEITDWIARNNCANGTIFVTCGTLEYFTQQELQDLLTLIRQKVSRAVFAICEPISFDIEKEQVSKPRGNTAYSHNYPEIFRRCGWHIFRQQRIQINPSVKHWENVTMVASTFEK